MAEIAHAITPATGEPLRTNVRRRRVADEPARATAAFDRATGTLLADLVPWTLRAGQAAVDAERPALSRRRR